MKRFDDLVRKSGVGWTFAGVAARALGQWAFIWLLVRWFGPAEVGLYGFASAWVTPIAAFASLHLMRFQATDINQDFTFIEYFRLRCVTSFFALVLIGGGILFADSSVRVLILVLAVQHLLLNVVQVFQGRILQAGSSAGYGRSLLEVNVASWSAGIVGLLITRRIEIAVLLAAVGAFAVLAMRLLPEVERIDDTRARGLSLWQFGRLTRRELTLLWATLPLGIGLLVDAAITQFPRLFLNSSAGAYELGILVGLLSFLSVGSLVIESITQAGTPHVTKLFAIGDFARLRRSLWNFTIVLFFSTIGLSVAAYTIGPRVAGVVLSEEYSHFPWALSGIAVIFGLQFAFRQYMIVVTAARRMGSVLLVNIISLLVAAVAAWVLIPRLGVDGAVATIAAANAARWLMISAMLIRVPGLSPTSPYEEDRPLRSRLITKNSDLA